MKASPYLSLRKGGRAACPPYWLNVTGDESMLTVGDKLPELTLPVQQGTSELPAGETIDLAQTNGKWKILFYWPKDFTFVCPTEIVGYGKLKGEFADRDAELIGASTDTAHVHFAWRRSDPELAAADFPWIADNGAQLASALGILDRNEHVAFRATFIVDPDNVIQHVTVQTDELCPCNWTKGEESLQPVAA
jgi:lipoyl-dependent peroxiredoxin subunit C